MLKGSAKFTLDGKERTAKVGEVVEIAKRQFHTFGNASTAEELEIEFTLNPASPETDEAYFRESQVALHGMIFGRI